LQDKAFAMSEEIIHKKKRRNFQRKNAEVTVDHVRIKEWVESRQGTPASVKGSGGDEPAGILRIDFPGYSSKASLEKISWEAFFNKFEERKLAFLFQENTAAGPPSRYWKLVKRDAAK
jgi:hypothetical protein